jgi:glycosyltransferase involved in cell wall biosynthesis
VATPFLSVVIPAFNEEKRIGATLEAVLAYLGEQAYAWEVLVVDDGSFDGTAAIAARFVGDDKRVKIERLRHAGKGWAVRHGMLAASGDYRFMCDADLAMPIQQLGDFVRRMAEGHDIVIGSRQKAGARRFGEPFGRHIMGRVFNWCVRMLAVRGFEDTQCGFKCFRGSVADELFRLQRTKGFAFDVEILYMAARKGLKVIEIPIDWHHQESSKVRPYVDSFVMLRDATLVKLRGLKGWRKT